MAVYRPDYTMQKATEEIEKIMSSNEPEHVLLKYYLQKMKKRDKEKDEKIQKYKQFFSLLNELTPKRYVAPTVFGSKS